MTAEQLQGGVETKNKTNKNGGVVWKMHGKEDVEV